MICFQCRALICSMSDFDDGLESWSGHRCLPTDDNEQLGPYNGGTLGAFDRSKEKEDLLEESEGVFGGRNDTVGGRSPRFSRVGVACSWRVLMETHSAYNAIPVGLAGSCPQRCFDFEPLHLVAAPCLAALAPRLAAAPSCHFAAISPHPPNGGASDMLATCVIQPIDIIKVRIQLGQGSAAQVTTTMLKNEGVAAFYKARSRVKDLPVPEFCSLQAWEARASAVFVLKLSSLLSLPPPPLSLPAPARSLNEAVPLHIASRHETQKSRNDRSRTRTAVLEFLGLGTVVPTLERAFQASKTLGTGVPSPR
ncbi:hypothetical protein Fmac_001464 [Flemingia macrophylla]|uniref:Uncharacterized protein n=1 Tax=Flemingia macrophylla TaxID=520843 RepID=A0ABD1NH72_9FABA